MWDPREWEDRTRIDPQTEDTEIDLGATIVERLWGVNGRKRWLEALAEAEKTGVPMT